MSPSVGNVNDADLRFAPSKVSPVYLLYATAKSCRKEGSSIQTRDVYSIYEYIKSTNDANRAIMPLNEAKERLLPLMRAAEEITNNAPTALAPYFRAQRNLLAKSLGLETNGQNVFELQRLSNPASELFLEGMSFGEAIGWLKASQDGIEERTAIRIKANTEKCARAKTAAKKRATKLIRKFIADAEEETNKRFSGESPSTASSAAFNELVFTIGNMWKDTVLKYEAKVGTPALPEGLSHPEVYPSELGSNRLPQLSLLQRIAARLRALGRPIGSCIAASGGIAVAIFSYFGIPAPLTEYAVPAFIGSAAFASVGAGWAGWGYLSEDRARRDFRRICINKLRDKNAELIELLAKTYDAKADRADEAFAKDAKEKLKIEIELLKLAEELASRLSQDALATTSSNNERRFGRMSSAKSA